MRYEITMVGEDQSLTYEGYDAEDAAQKFAKEYNEDGDYALMNNCELVLVKDVESGEVVIVSISAEPDVHYSSSELTSVKCRECTQELLEHLKSGKEMYDGNFCSRNCYCVHYKIATP